MRGSFIRSSQKKSEVAQKGRRGIENVSAALLQMVVTAAFSVITLNERYEHVWYLLGGTVTFHDLGQLN